MPLARILAAVIVICSACAFAQEKSDLLAASDHATKASKTAQVASSEPWRIIPNQRADVRTGRNPQDRLQIGDYKVFQFKGDGRAGILNLDAMNPGADAGMLVPDLKEQLDDGTTCYTMRSFVVARDAKDSDSTHPVSSSTCQKASRYHVKSVETPQRSDGR